MMWGPQLVTVVVDDKHSALGDHLLKGNDAPGRLPEFAKLAVGRNIQE